MKFLEYENYNHGLTGYSNSLMSYMVGVGLSYLLNRTYVFRYKTPPSVKPPALSKWGKITEKYSPTIDQLFKCRVPTIDEESYVLYKKDNALTVEYLNHNTSPIHQSYYSTVDREENLDNFANSRTRLLTYNVSDVVHVDKSSLSYPSYFFHIPKGDKNYENFFGNILKVEARDEYENFAAKVIESIGYKNYHCIHIRRGDFKNVPHHRTSKITCEHIRDSLVGVIPKDKMLIISTDESNDTNYFLPLIKEYPHSVFLDDLLLGNTEFYKEFLDLPYHEHIVLGLITQLICAASDIFVGTISSTFTGMIHTLRMQRHQEFSMKFLYNFNENLSLDSKLEYKEELEGEYTWNRIKDFSMNGSCSWMREWPDNHDNFYIA